MDRPIKHYERYYRMRRAYTALWLGIRWRKLQRCGHDELHALFDTARAFEQWWDSGKLDEITPLQLLHKQIDNHPILADDQTIKQLIKIYGTEHYNVPPFIDNYMAMARLSRPLPGHEPPDWKPPEQRPKIQGTLVDSGDLRKHLESLDVGKRLIITGDEETELYTTAQETNLITTRISQLLLSRTDWHDIDVTVERHFLDSHVDRRKKWQYYIVLSRNYKAMPLGQLLRHPSPDIRHLAQSINEKLSSNKTQ